MTIKANLSGVSLPDQQKREFLLGDQACANCGQRTCEGNCVSLNRIPPGQDEDIRTQTGAPPKGWY